MKTLILALVVGSLSSPQTIRETVKVTPIDRENLLITSKQPIESIYIDDMYENTDYMLWEGANNKEYTVRMLTTRGPLKFIIKTEVPNTHGLIRKHKITHVNPDVIFRKIR